MTIDTNPKPKPRRLISCLRHPNQPVTSLCPHCLHERLSLLNPSTSTTTSSSSSSSNTAAAPAGVASSSSSAASSSTALPQLRRCKTFSGNNCDSVGLSFEPRRRSCEVRRSGNTLEALFTSDDGDGAAEKCRVETKNLGFFKGTYPVPVLREVDEEYEEEGDSSSGEIRVSAVDALDSIDNKLNVTEEFEEDSKTMKEFIDLELDKNRKFIKKDLKEMAGSFWIAASVFSKKFHKWKKKQKSTSAMITAGGGCGECSKSASGYDPGRRSLGEMRIENVRGRRLLRETQSEVGEYGLGRRSCDTDPRVSIDLGRASVDGGGRISVDGIGRRVCDPDPRCLLDLGRASIDCGRISVDEGRLGGGGFDVPRASWDGYLISGKSIGRGAGGTTNVAAAATPMVSVIENAMATVYGFDNPALSAEKLENDSGRRRSFGAAYGYLDSVSLRLGKKGGSSLFDGSDSKRSMNMVETKANEDCESKLLASSQIKKPVAAPSSQIEIFHGTKLVITEKELMGSRMNSHRDDSSDSFDTSSKEMNSNSSASSSSTGNGHNKKPGRWNKLLKAFGLVTRQKQGHYDAEEENTTNGRNVLQNPGNTKDRNDGRFELDSSWKLVRSASVVSSRRSLFRRHEDVILERNRSAINHLDNTGLLRFYLTPSRGSRRSKFGKSKLSRSDSLARSVLKL